MKRGNGVELNRRGLPARKRKKNSLIYGTDDLVTIPVKSPKKKFSLNKSSREPEPMKNNSFGGRNKIDSFEDDIEEDEDDVEEDLEDMEDKSDDFYEEPEPVRPLKPLVKKKDCTSIIKVQNDFEEEISLTSRLNAQRLGMALRNLLKLPKAHKWVCFEFFYSNIDK